MYNNVIPFGFLDHVKVGRVTMNFCPVYVKSRMSITT